ncbi:MAG: CoA pyrophosphatase [Firmicutes bacterium]|nr:CoA pyrophosphatase [Bacillota bacterium]
MEDHIARLSERKPGIMGREHYLVSAVLLPLIEGAGGPELLFEVRSRLLERQPGEICFPGGRVEDGETGNPADAAVRETAEELGLNKKDIEVIAPLDFLVSPMGNIIYPYVGRVRAPGLMAPNREEVDEIFTVPLSFLTAYRPQVSIVDVAIRYNNDFPVHRVPKIYRGDVWQKRWSHPTYIYEYRGYFIWGMTASILHHFLLAVSP